MAKTTKTTKATTKKASSKTTAKPSAKRNVKPSAFHHAVFAKPATAKRCGHQSKSGKVCCRFTGHEEKGRTPHFYVTKAELKKRVEAWEERFSA